MPNDELQALGLLGNALALPKRLEHASQQSAMMRALLSQNADTLGLTPAQIDQLAPDPGLGAINPSQHPGTYGKILSGVGGVGNVISSLLGSPLEPPRLDLSTITALGGLRDKAEKKKALNTYADTLPDESSKALARAGYPASAAKSGQGKGSGELGLLDRISNATNPAEKVRLQAMLTDFRKSKQENALAVGRGMSPVLAERGENQADIQTRKELRVKAAEKLQAVGSIEERVLPMMERARSALTTSPVLAGSGAQSWMLWWKALQGDDAAAAVGQLPSQIASLARLSDVGNLSKNEQDVWDIFLKGENMTAQQFLLAERALKKVLRNIARRELHTYETGEIQMPKVLQDRTLDDDQGEPPAARDRVHVGTSATPPPAGAEDFQILDVRPKR